jgi:peroxiredoxin
MLNKKAVVCLNKILTALILPAVLGWIFLFPASGLSQPYRTAPSEPVFSMEKYLGKKLLLFFYDINSPNSVFVAKKINDLYRIRNEYNFNVAGICLNTNRKEAVDRFNKENNISFDVVLDHNRATSKKLRMRGGLGLYIFDKKGRSLSRKLIKSTQSHTSLSNSINLFTSRYLNIGYIPEDMPVLGIKPAVPLFKAKAIDNSTINIKDIFEEKPVVLVVFSPTCGHCKKELEFLTGLYNDKTLKDKFEIIAVSMNSGVKLNKLLEEKKYPFPVIADPQKKIASRFPSYTGTVPISFVIDRKGRINFFHRGFTENMKKHYPMELKKLLAQPNPPLLSATGYSGDRSCQICHEEEHNQWKLTQHSNAFHSLIRKGKEDDDKCVSCHVTGYGKPGGYTLGNKKQSKYFKNVQCEACHGPGHESCSAFTNTKPKKKKLSEWKAVCLVCHTKKESLNFKFSGRFKKVIHSNAPDLSSMTRAERLQLARTLKEQQTVFDSPAKYMGKDTCVECHEKEFKHWQTTEHAQAYKSERAKKSGAEKVFRYNTGPDSLEGYAKNGLESVQCEACHGPGERHIKNPEEKGQDFIVGLGKECPSCVVEQICRQCHSVNDDPDFEFEKEFEKIRHK